MKRILMVASEAEPFAKVGGLGEAVSALSAELLRQGCDVRIILPRYYSVDLVREKLKKYPSPLGVPLGAHEEWTGVYEGSLPGCAVPVYFLEHEGYYGRDGIYGPRGGEGFADNVARFALLCRGAFQLCRMTGWIPDIIHSHDWPAALCNVYLKTLENHTEFSKTAAVFTLHNAGYQGVYHKDDMNAIGLSWEHFYSSGFEFYNKINLLQAGIKNADMLTTVSPGYAREILTPEKGNGMDGLLRERGECFTGILNGIDYSLWDPGQDPFLPYHFSEKTLTEKEKLKNRLRREVSLPANQDAPLIGMIGRIVDQKGYGVLLAYSRTDLAAICRELGVQMIILGTGNAAYEQELARLAWKLPNLKVILQFNTQLAHLIEAGSDFFLMPSIFEPCGLNQLYSLRYGAIPIVSNTGGLADTVEDYNEQTGKGTGLIIETVTSENIYNAIKRATELFRNNKTAIRTLREQGMKKRFSWKQSAREYLAAYEKAIANRNKQTSEE
ncbi:MAG: glycogen synthase [Spirochaetales bacterium]|jgi:starch synthase|nr:glycogen synthase [Spirochaetales bacterium]